MKCQRGIGYLSLSFVKIMPQHRLTRDQGHKVKRWNCNNSASDCPISLFGTEFRYVTGDTLQDGRDFKLGMGVVIKADEDWRGVRQPQVAMHP